jgi:hypothetical protein
MAAQIVQASLRREQPRLLRVGRTYRDYIGRVAQRSRFFFDSAPGPILRCSKGDLRAEVKRVVWHEVAHWLGYETEEQVEALGL